MHLHDLAAWHADWLWSLPLIVITIVIQVLGLGQMNHVIDRLLGKQPDSRPTALRFILTLIFAALASTILLSLSALIWATTYLYLGALGNGQIALLYSLSALTSYGHTPIYLEEQWQLMGALESLD